jgi:uncharacterized protein (DUF885 family)
MKPIVGIALLLSAFCMSCNNNPAITAETTGNDSATINRLFAHYWEDRMRLYPLEATTAGDNRYNHIFQNEVSVAFINEAKHFYSSYLDSIKVYDREKLNDNDRISYDIFKREMEMQLERFNYREELMPLNQFWGKQITFGMLGSGDGDQPFKSVKDYDNFLGRIDGFAIYMDTVISNMRTGMNQGYILPKSLIIKMIPQTKDMLSADAKSNHFYAPIKKMPDTFTIADKTRLTEAYTKAITEKLVPAFTKLNNFLQQEYLPKGRSSSGIDSIPNGNGYYQYLIRYWTTTNQSADEIYNTGLKEVERIKTEMEKIKTQVGFTGDLKAFFNYILTDKKFSIFKTPEEVLEAFRAIQAKEEPYLKKLFGRFPTTKFEIRRTEAFREQSASAEYNQATEDGSRPGIFYTPIPDVTKFNYTGMETLFAHEAIPGHHYQISLQQENKSLPAFRRFGWYGAYGEGWALYTESLGAELGLYTDPYQKMGNLGDEMLRAVRLVVDAGIHTKSWSREKAIDYLLANLPSSEQEAVAAIERYMAIPAQALSYKMGAIFIKQLREKYTQQLGAKFNIAAFHDELLKDGCMPLDVLDRKMETWAKKQ